MMTIETLNQLSEAEFVSAIGFVFEATPSIAAQAWQQRPFRDRDHLHDIMGSIVHHLPIEQKLALICAHPDLGSKAKMADASVQEQASAGLNQLTPAEYEQFQSVNRSYTEKFGFPFIIAVKDNTKATILEAFQTRLKNDRQVEIDQAIVQIKRIAWYRIMGFVAPPYP